MTRTPSLVPIVAALPLVALFHCSRSAARSRAGRAKPLTVEAIFAHGPLIGQPPGELTWSPDGKHLTYLDGGELMDVDAGDGQGARAGEPRQAGSAGRRATAQRQDRDHRDRYKMASYLWAPDSAHLLFDSERPAVALRSAQRHGRADGLYRSGFGRRSEVLARWRIPSRSSATTGWP